LAATTGDCEAFSVGLAGATVATSVEEAASGSSWNGSEVTGATALDTATVTGSAGVLPSGTLTYARYDNATCTGDPATTQTVTLNAGLAPASDASGALPAGTYSFKASYSGDSSYGVATGSCETFSVGRAAASVTSAVLDAATQSGWSGSEQAGASARATATLAGVSGIAPTGTLT